jgi:uncharacterized membrane protein YhaH (DUF805 family)
MFNYFKKLFVGRINRAQFLYAQIILATLTVFAVLVATPFWMASTDFLARYILPFSDGGAQGVFLFSILAPIFFLAIWLLFCFSLSIRRIHDTGKGGWWNLLLLFPPTQIWLLVATGQKTMNPFGEEPQPNRNIFGVIFQGQLPLVEQRQKLRSMKIYKFLPTILSLAYLLAIFIFFFFQWVIQDIVSLFLFPLLEGAAYLTLFAFLIWATHNAIKNKFKNITLIAPLLVGIATILLIIYFPYTTKWLGWDFNHKLSERERVVGMIKEGKLVPNVSHNPTLIHLPDSLGMLSLGGNDIVVTREEGDLHVFFFTFRGILDNYSGFMYSESGGDPEQPDFRGDTPIEAIKMADHWYYVAFN